MSIEIQLGWWMLPLAITIVAYTIASVWSSHNARSSSSGNDYFGTGALFDGIVWLLCLSSATIISLIAWLIWAVLT